MIERGPLAQWLADPARQQQTASRIEEVRRRVGSGALLADFREGVKAADGSLERLLTATQRLFARRDELEQLLLELIEASREDPFARPPFRLVATPMHSGLLLFDSPDVVVSLGVVRLEPLAAKKASASGPSSIIFSGHWSVLRFVRGGDAMLSIWAADDTGDLPQEDVRCRLVERRRVADGDILVFNGRRESFVIEGARSDIVLLQANIHSGSAPHTIEYDSRTHEFVGATSAQEASSRVELMATLLRLLDARDAVPLLIDLISSAGFHTRWHLMRELLAWDAQAAFPVLRQMAEHDPHPEVKAAARETFELFFQDQPSAEGSLCLA